MNLHQKTYVMEKQAPPSMPWDRYKVLVEERWEQLLASDPDEASIQNFLEQHPSMLPGAFGAIGSSGHSPHPSAIISQPPLSDFSRHIPDFMWIAQDSSTIYPVLIEIEAPRKRWFTKAGRATAQLTEAINQLHDWKAWFSQPHNQANFVRHYQVSTQGRPLVPQFVLVFGRRAELAGRAALNAKRAAMEATDQVLMTYDRLTPDPKASQLMTVRLTTDGFRAVHVPPTFQLGPMLAAARAQVADKSAAVERNVDMTSERKAFLKLRSEYWDAWVGRGERGIRNLGDWE